MKLSKRLRGPRFAPTIELVDEREPRPQPSEPESEPEPEPDAAEPARRRRAWTVLKVAAPALTVAVALLVAVLTLPRQSPAPRDIKSPAITGVELSQQAGEVAFWPDQWAQPPFASVFVENLASTPVSDVKVQVIVNVTGAYLKKPIRARLVLALNGVIPSCAVGSVNIADAAIAAVAKPAGVTTSRIMRSRSFSVWPLALMFRFTNGSYWQDSGVGALSEISAHAATAEFRPSGSVHVTTGFQPASECT